MDTETGFWSNALAVYARDQGPRMTNLGNAQEIFSRPAPLNGAGLLFAPAEHQLPSRVPTSRAGRWFGRPPDPSSVQMCVLSGTS